MCAFTHPVGIAVGIKPGFKKRLNNVAQGMMHHPISKRGGTDFAPFGFVDKEMAVCTGAILLADEFILQGDEVIC